MSSRKKMKGEYVKEKYYVKYFEVFFSLALLMDES
jgi:hypothetical protein